MAVKQPTKPAAKGQSKIVPPKPQEVVKTQATVAQEPQMSNGDTSKFISGAISGEEKKDPVVMQAIEDGLKGKSGITVKQNIVVQGDGPILIKAFEKAILRGARFKQGTFPQLNNYPKHIEMEVELDLSDDEWENDVPNGLHCSPVGANTLTFDKETMDSLPWETFRKVVGKHGVFGRDRKVMLTDYLKRTDQEA